MGQRWPTAALQQPRIAPCSLSFLTITSARGQLLQTLLPLFEGLNLDATRQSGASLCVGGIVADRLVGNSEHPLVEARGLCVAPLPCVCFPEHHFRITLAVGVPQGHLQLDGSIDGLSPSVTLNVVPMLA